MHLYPLLFANLRRQWARSFAPKNRFWKVAGLALLGLYVAAVLVSLGFLFTEVIRRWMPGEDPVFLLNRHLLAVFGGLFLLRFAAQRTPRLDVARYLQLPVSRTALVLFFQLSALVNLHTILPLLFFLPFWVRHFVAGAWPGDQPGLWLAGVVCMLLLSQFLLVLVRALSPRGLRWVLAAGVGVTVLFVAGVLPLDDLTLRASVLLFTGLRSGDASMLVFPVAGTLVAFAASSLLLRARLLQDESADGRGWLSRPVTFSARYGEVYNLVLMELQLVWRNRRPRSVLAHAVLFGTVPVLLLLLDRSGGVSIYAALAVLLASGSFALNYGQLLFSWESRYFDGFLLRGHAPRSIVWAKLVLLQGSCLAFYAVSLPLVGGLLPHLVPLHLAFLLYNAGINAPLLLGLALRNEQRIDPDRAGVTNFEGLTLRHLLLFIPTMMPPLALLFAFRAVPDVGVLVLGATGLAGVVLSAVWVRLLAQRLSTRTYEMAYGFKRYDY